MPKPHGPTFKQLSINAAHTAEFYFSLSERSRMLSEAGCRPDGEYIVLVGNQYTLIETLSGCVAMLRNFVKGLRLDDPEAKLLREYWSQLDSTQTRVSEILEREGICSAAYEVPIHHKTCPAIGLASSEAELRLLLTQQFNQIQKNKIQWVGVDSSTHTFPMWRGAYAFVTWFWHGY
jgi:hypothetical protein